MEAWRVLALLLFGAVEIWLYIRALREAGELDRQGLRTDAVAVATELREVPCTDAGVP